MNVCILSRFLLAEECSTSGDMPDSMLWGNREGMEGEHVTNRREKLVQTLVCILHLAPYNAPLLYLLDCSPPLYKKT